MAFQITNTSEWNFSKENTPKVPPPAESTWVPLPCERKIWRNGWYFREQPLGYTVSTWVRYHHEVWIQSCLLSTRLRKLEYTITKTSVFYQLYLFPALDQLHGIISPIGIRKDSPYERIRPTVLKPETLHALHFLQHLMVIHLLILQVFFFS